MPLCWSASPSWTPVFILSCHSQMVSPAPTKLPGGILKVGPEMASKGRLEVVQSLLLHPQLPEEVQICLGSTKLVHLQVFSGVEHELEQKGLGKHRYEPVFWEPELEPRSGWGDQAEPGSLCWDLGLRLMSSLL